MKKRLSLFIFSMLIIVLIGCTKQMTNKSESGQWTQYRFNKENNPVIHTSSPITLNTTLKTDNQLRATPVVVGHRLYIGNHQSGSIQAFNLDNGKRLWKTTAPNWIHSETVYKNGKLYVGYGNRLFKKVNGVSLRGTGASGVLCLDASTGKKLWEYKTKGEVMPTPVLYKNQVIIADGDRVLHVVNQKTGKQEWKLHIGSIVSMSSPVEENGVLYFGSSQPYTFFAINLNNHKVLWKDHFSKVVAGLDDVPPVISGKLVITTALEGTLDHPDHKIYALNKKTGHIQWVKDLGAGKMVPNNKSGAPMIYKGNVYVASPITRKMYAFDATTGKVLWEKQNDAVMKAPPVATNNKVYFTDANGRVIALDYRTGKELGSKQLNGRLAPAGPIIVDNRLIVGSQDSNVYIVKLF